MNRQMRPPGKPSGSQYEQRITPSNDNKGNYKAMINSKEVEDDLIIEDNTVYEIDRECYERLKRQRKKR